MKYFKNAILLLAMIYAGSTWAQQAAAVDSIKASFAKAIKPEDKVYWLDNLSRTLMNVNLQEAEEYGKKIIAVAEESRNRDLMIKAYMSNGLRCSYFSTQKDFAKRSIEFYNKALEIAKLNKMEERIGEAQLRLSAVYLSIPDKEKALSFANEAFSLISTLKNDSLKAEAHNAYGHVYLAKNDKTLALRHYLNALRIAEEKKNSALKRHCYLFLSTFYSRIENYDKAIDYHTLAYNMLDKMDEKNIPYQRAVDLNSIGNLFSYKKNYDLAIEYFERSIAMADSLKFATLKIPGYISLLNQHLRMDQPLKALAYLNSDAGQALKGYLKNFGFAAMIDQAYAVIYTEVNRFDSAGYYYNKALPYFEHSTGENNKINLYAQLAHFYKKTGYNKKAISYFLQVQDIGDRLGMLEHVKNASKELDSLYASSGNHQLASTYSAKYYLYKDSIEVLNRENELAQIEATDEQQRLERIEMEKAEAKRKRHSIQYTSIILGIAVLFIVMVMMGFFKVSAGTIRAIGFFSFLIFFEFIFLVFKKNIYGITEGEPWKDLAFMIGLAALLVPLHHWLEHKVIHFLTSHHMLKFRKIFSKKDQGSSS